MRKICLILLTLALAVPVAALASDRSAGDGTLSVAAATGSIVIQGKGVLYGRLDQGTLLVLDYRPDDPSAVIAVSTGRTKFNGGASSYAGNDIRFLLPSGRYTIKLMGSGLNASAVGKGTVVADGAGTANDGTLAVNGGKPIQLTTQVMSQGFGATAVAATSTKGG